MAMTEFSSLLISEGYDLTVSNPFCFRVMDRYKMVILQNKPDIARPLSKQVSKKIILKALKPKYAYANLEYFNMSLIILKLLKIL